MKKVSLLTALLICLGAFASCGDTDSEKSSSKDSDTTQAYELNDDDDNETDDEKETDEEVTENETEEETDAPAESDGDSDFIKGEISGNVYTSEFGNLRFTAPDGWNFSSEDDILAMMGLSQSVVDTGVDLDSLIAEQIAIYDAQAMSTTGDNVLFMFENLKKEGVTFQLSADDYIAILKQNFSNINGITYSNYSDPKTFKLGNDEYTYFSVDSTYESYNMTITQTYAFRIMDDYSFSFVYSGGGCTDFENEIISRLEAVK